MKFLTASVLCACVASSVYGGAAQIIGKANKHAAYHPNGKQFVNAGMVFNWEKNRIYQVYTKPDRITDIALEPGENLLAIAGGDTQRWTLSESQSGSGATLTKHVFVKPHQVGIASNLILSTDRRVYHIELHANKSVPYQAVVSWNYPRSMVVVSRQRPEASTGKKKPKTPLAGLASAQLDFSYHFVAKSQPKWMPHRVFNDGHKTYIEFPLTMQDGEAPALWRLTPSKEREVINYRRYKNFYIIDSLVELAELSLGDKNKITIGIEREARS